MDDLYLTKTPADVERKLAQRIRAARKARRWTQATLAERSGLSVATLARIEQTGQGQISSFVRICAALDRLDDFDDVLAAPVPSTLEDLRRQRGSRP